MDIEIFRITDGTAANTVNLLNSKAGIIVEDGWNPKVAGLKAGGVFRDNPLTDGRSPIMRKYANVVENIPVKIVGGTSIVVDDTLRKLRELLEMAATYWTSGWQGDLVWIEIKERCTPELRYGIIANWATPEESNPFVTPRSGNGSSVVENFQIMIERLPFWSLEEPGADGTPVELGTLQTYDGRTVGNVDSTGTLDPTTDPNYFKCAHHISQLTDIYLDDGGAVGPNLMDAILPYFLLPAVPVNGDILYFGVDQGVADSGLFTNMVLDIGTVGTNYTLTWEYSTGGPGWAVFGGVGAVMNDETNDFKNAGVGAIFWEPPSTWAPQVFNGVNAYWVRATVTIGVGPTGATQQNRDVFTANWPYVELQNDQIGGDVAALARIKMQGIGAKPPNRVAIGARSVSRGDDFTAYLEIADQENFPGVTVANIIGAATFQTDIQYAATTRYVRHQVGAAWAMISHTTITLDSTIANQWHGKFHAYLVAKQVGGVVGDCKVQVVFRSVVGASLYLSYFTKEVLIEQTSAVPYPIDLGPILLPPGNMKPGEIVNTLRFDIRSENTNVAGGQINFYQLILLPVDEWAGAFETDTPAMIEPERYLDIDSITYPKQPTYCPLRITASDYLVNTYRNINVTPVQLNKEARIRLWMMNEYDLTLGVFPRVQQYYNGQGVQIEQKQRYWTVVGSNT